MVLPNGKGNITTRSVSFEVAIFEDRIKKSCSCSMKWCSCSYSNDRIRARAPSSTEYEREHENPRNDASRVSKSASSKSVSEGRTIPQNPSLTRRVGIKATWPYASDWEVSICLRPIGSIGVVERGGFAVTLVNSQSSNDAYEAASPFFLPALNLPCSM